MRLVDDNGILAVFGVLDGGQRKGKLLHGGDDDTVAVVDGSSQVL